MFTHVDQNNNPTMVNVSEKQVTYREATAYGVINLGESILKMLSGKEIVSKKGPVFATAIIAGTMAVKKTAELIPFCHPLNVEKIKIEINQIDAERVEVISTVGLHAKTGVEMEALTGVHVAMLTIHDMCKAINSAIAVEKIYLQKKTGGKKDFERKEYVKA